MSGTTDELRRLTQAVLDKLKERQQTIERSIAILEDDLSRPPFVSHIDFEAIKEEARSWRSKMNKKLFEVDFKIDGKVADTIKLREFTPDTLMYEDDVVSYTSADLEVGVKHLPIQVIIRTRKSIAEELGWWQEVSPANKEIELEVKDG